MKPRLLDLFCGAGGAAVGYHRAGFEVVGVDIKQHPNYPFEFIEHDVLDLLKSPHMYAPYWLDTFDAIHASPPCQRWSTKTKDPEKHPDLITPLRPLLSRSPLLPYVIENVPGAPLRASVMLCGSMFGLGVRRHRIFETSFPMLNPSCRHEDQRLRYRLYDHGHWYLSRVVHVFGTGGGKGRDHWQEAMGIDWTNDTDELREAIPPAYTEFIGAQLLQHVKAEAVA